MTVRNKLDLGHRIAPPRFLAFLGASVAGFGIALQHAGWARAALIGFDAGAAIFLLSCVNLFGHRAKEMRAAAARNDANRALLLVITAMLCITILVAIAVELSDRGTAQRANVALVIGTLLLAWLFANMVYTLHYAHLFYRDRPGEGGDQGGIDFPGTNEPDYGDFVYFAFTIGMTFQTSDSAISSRPIRRTIVLHSFAAFIFNIGILAFTINVLGGG